MESPMTASRPTSAVRPRPALRDFDLTQVASHLLRRAHFRAEALFAQAFPDEDLTPRQKALLITVHQHPGATQSRIAELIALDRNSFAEMIARMTARAMCGARARPRMRAPMHWRSPRPAWTC